MHTLYCSCHACCPSVVTPCDPCYICRYAPEDCVCDCSECFTIQAARYQAAREEAAMSNAIADQRARFYRQQEGN